METTARLHSILPTRRCCSRNYCQTANCSTDCSSLPPVTALNTANWDHAVTALMWQQLHQVEGTATNLLN